MTDVNQVRINELARELEVKAKAIIDLLPGYGVTEKKTHSSSIPADVAEKVRKNILGHAEEEAKAEAAASQRHACRHETSCARRAHRKTGCTGGCGSSDGVSCPESTSRYACGSRGGETCRSTTCSRWNINSSGIACGTAFCSTPCRSHGRAAIHCAS